jgi:hypothetical protein
MEDSFLHDSEYHRRNLVRAREHVNQAQKLVEKQRLLISSIKAGGELSAEAESLLAHLEDSLEFLLRHHDKLAKYVNDIERTKSQSVHKQA